MGQKVDPRALRLGITTPWKSRWFSDKAYARNLQHDHELRSFTMERWKKAAIEGVEVERSAGVTRIVIRTSRPGVLIGRAGAGVEDMMAILKRRFFANRPEELKIDIQEIRQFEESASLIAQNVAEQLERRLPFRRVLKTTLDQVGRSKIVKGVKVEIAGRLGGAEMSRREWLSRGRIPLHTLRSRIDFSRATARTTYGTIGVKVWLYKGDLFD